MLWHTMVTPRCNTKGIRVLFGTAIMVKVKVYVAEIISAGFFCPWGMLKSDTITVPWVIGHVWTCSVSFSISKNHKQVLGKLLFQTLCLLSGGWH